MFLTPETKHDQIEQIVLSEYEDIIQKGVTTDELLRAKAQMRASVAFSRDGSYAVASALNEAIAIGDWQFYTTYLDKIKSVTVKDIKKVSKKYLHDDASTTGWFVPKQ